MFKKLGSILLLSLVLVFSSGAMYAEAYTPLNPTEGDGAGSGNVGNIQIGNIGQVKQLVQSDGFITNFETGWRLCVTDYGVEGDLEPISEEPGLLAGITERLEHLREVAVIGFFNFLLDSLENISLCNSAGESADDSTNLGFFTQANVFAQLVNVTHVRPIMFLTGLLQRIALVGMVLFVVMFAYQALRGNRFEEGSTFKFFARFGIAMFAVYAAPWIVQDILNLNNQLTFLIANQDMNLVSNLSSVTSEGTRVTVGDAFVASFAVFLMGIIEQGLGFPDLAINAVIYTIVIIAVLVPMVKVVIWWYTRMFKLFVYTVISPIMFAMFGSEKTEQNGRNFVSNLVTTVFEQFFVVIGMAIVTAFLSHVPLMMQTLGLGNLGVGLAMFAAFSFVAQLPKLASGMLQGNVGGDAMGVGSLGGATKKLYRGSKSAVKGAGRAGQAHMRRREIKRNPNGDVAKAVQAQKKHRANKALYGDKVANSMQKKNKAQPLRAKKMKNPNKK